MKNVVANGLRDAEDLMPQLVLFSVELFHALYVVTCLQTVGSVKASLVVITIDALNLLWSLYTLHIQISKLQRCADRLCEASSLGLDDESAVGFVQRVYAVASMNSRDMVGFKVRLRTFWRYQLRVDDATLTQLLTKASGQALVQSRMTQAANRLAWKASVHPLQELPGHANEQARTPSDQLKHDTSRGPSIPTRVDMVS